ncbi:MAG: 7-cyano-7-deazaguanine synthase QueC [Thermacetogeniaceae bacterium]
MKQIVLLSGGLDSAVCLAKAVREGEVRLALNFSYGQRAEERERESARKLAEHYGVPFEALELPFLKSLTDTALVSEEMPLPEPDPDDLDDPQKGKENALQVWVPNRNGLFVNIAACYAESLGCDLIVAGFNAEEAKSFPDNSADFVEAANRAFFYSTRTGVRLISYTQELTKAEIARLGAELGLPFELVWSCYRGDERMCGRCESCRRFRRAVGEAGLVGILRSLGWL